MSVRCQWPNLSLQQTASSKQAAPTRRQHNASGVANRPKSPNELSLALSPSKLVSSFFLHHNTSPLATVLLFLRLAPLLRPNLLFSNTLLSVITRAIRGPLISSHSSRLISLRFNSTLLHLFALDSTPNTNYSSIALLSFPASIPHQRHTSQQSRASIKHLWRICASFAVALLPSF